MALEGWDAEKFVKDFDRDMLNARKRAGRKIGRKVVSEAKRALGKVDRKRKSMIKSKVVKTTGSLVVIDRAIDSRVREYGADIRAKGGGMLRIDLDPKDRGVASDFAVTKGGTTLLFSGIGEEARPIAVLKKSVKRQAVVKNKRISDIAERKFDDYAQAIEEELTNG
jgi:hypothetical protein